MFEKRHYEAIAKAIRVMATPGKTKADMIEIMTIVFARDNPRFDPDRFAAACIME
jgi:hypothetical protein